MQSRWESFNAFLQGRKNILITTHINPDGDALGSEIELAHYFVQRGISFRIINADPTPAYFQFLDPEHWIEQFDVNRHVEQLSMFDCCIVLDVGEYRRLGGMCDIIKEASLPIACIDHHISMSRMGDVHVTDNHYSSTGELVYDLLKENNAHFTQEIVDALYTCILTDTGSFRFSNTTALTHQIAADLMEKKARFEYIYAQIYESDSKNRSLLKGRLLADMHFEYEDRYAWFALTQDILKKTGTQIWEAEGFSELPRSVKSVEISIMFTESEDGLVKASFRSKGKFPVNDLAEQFGGGGHKFAAGAALSMTLDEAILVLRRAVQKHLEKHSDTPSA